jgi:phospholipid transport system transporter-binding protein
MSKLTVTELSPGNYSVEGCLTFNSIDKNSPRSFAFLKGIDSICIDLAKVEATDSAGLALMIEWIKLSKANKIKLSFKNIPQQILALAKLSGFDDNEYFNSVPN